MQDLSLLALQARVWQTSLPSLLLELVVLLDQVLGSLLEVQVVVLDQSLFVQIGVQSAGDDRPVVLGRHGEQAAVRAERQEQGVDPSTALLVLKVRVVVALCPALSSKTVGVLLLDLEFMFDVTLYLSADSLLNEIQLAFHGVDDLPVALLEQLCQLAIRVVELLILNIILLLSSKEGVQKLEHLRRANRGRPPWPLRVQFVEI